MNIIHRRRLIKDAIVLVIDNPKEQVPSSLVSVVHQALMPHPGDVSKHDQVDLAHAIFRLLDSFALLLTLSTGKSLYTVENSYGLYSPLTLQGLSFLGIHNLLFKSIKTFGAWPMARALGETVPPESNDIHYSYLLGVKVRGYLNCFIPQGRKGLAVSDKVNVLANSVLSLKDSMMPVNASFVEASFNKYRKSLESEPEAYEERREAWKRQLGEGRESLTDTEQNELFDQVQDDIERSIAKTVNEVFKPVDCSRYRDDDVVPSSSSSFITPRAKGGAWQELLQNAVNAENESQGEKFLLRTSTDLIAMDFNPKTNKLIEIRGKIVFLLGEFVVSGKRVNARVVPILEPCKVRWVSIGEGKPYFRAKAWNKLIYSQMPHHPTFALVGRPLNKDDVNRMSHEYLLSGDYKGATDTLDPYWSELVFEKITQRVYQHDRGSGSVTDSDWATRVLGMKSMLTEHRLTYRQKGKDDISFDQNNGQLMGSYLSFPILCVLNAAINRLFLDPTLESDLADLPLLINGDDVMMSSDDDFTGWEAHVGLVGLKPSLGKNYVHTHVCCLNSEFYSRKNVSEEFHRIYPWRLNLCYGKDSDADGGMFGMSVNRPAHLQNATLGAMARTLVEFQNETVHDILLSKFISENRKVLDSTQRSWWIPETLGGLGLPLTVKTMAKVTPLARTVATYLYTRPRPEDVLLYAPRGSDKFTVSCREWMSACNKLLPAKGYTLEWLDETSVVPPPPLPLRDFLGYGSIPMKPEYRSRYRGLVKLAQAAKGLSPISDEKLYEFSLAPKRADWVRTCDTPEPDLIDEDWSYLDEFALGFLNLN